MLVYAVSWKADETLTKGKGRITHKDYDFYFTVLCRNMKDASFCLEYLFPKEYQGKFSLCDGEVKIYRYKIDSRGFDVMWLYMDGIKKPLKLSDLKQSLFDYSPQRLY